MSEPAEFFRSSGMVAKAVWRGSDHLLIVACGVLGNDPITRWEFESFAKRNLPNASVVFVRDTCIGWYARPAIFPFLEWLQAKRRHLSPRLTSMLGLSMGGFFTIAYSGLLSVDTAVSLSPQVRIDTQIDRRYERHYARWRPLIRTDLRSSRLPASLSVISGSEEWLDLWHLLGLRNSQASNRLMYGLDWNHNVGRELRDRDQEPWLASLLEGDPPKSRDAEIRDLSEPASLDICKRIVASNLVLINRRRSKLGRSIVSQNIEALTECGELLQARWTAVRALKYLGEYRDAARLLSKMPIIPYIASAYREGLHISRQAQDADLMARLEALAERHFPNDVRLSEERQAARRQFGHLRVASL